MKAKDLVPDWMIEKIEQQKRQQEQERQRPQLEIPAPEPVEKRQDPEKRKGGVIEIQVWQNDD